MGGRHFFRGAAPVDRGIYGHRQMPPSWVERSLRPQTEGASKRQAQLDRLAERVERFYSLDNVAGFWKPCLASS